MCVKYVILPQGFRDTFTIETLFWPPIEKQEITTSFLLFFLQALGCLLFKLCFYDHPFEDSAKLRIINANYVIPESDREFDLFHDLISKYIQTHSSI